MPHFSRYSGVNKINIFLLAFGLLIPCLSAAQKSYVLRLLATDLSQAELEKAVRYKTTFSDSTGVISELKSVIRQLHEKSMLEASADTVLRSDSIFTAFVHVGPAYTWLELQPGNARPDQLKAVGFRPGYFRNRPMEWPR